MVNSYDTVVKGGLVVLSSGTYALDIGIKDGVITAIEPNLDEGSVHVLNAHGHYVMPGVIDIHVHLNEPGFAHWEGFQSGSSALAAGGCTMYFDMPLNGIPPTISVPSLQLKLEAAQSQSYVDYGIWGGLVPGNIDELGPLAANGVIGFKAFMSSPGGMQEDAFQEVDDETLYMGMQSIARLNRILALHAESDSIIQSFIEQKQQTGKERGAFTAQDYADTRPSIAEWDAVRKALKYGEETGCALHFVHVSCIEAVEEIVRAKQRGMDVTMETCPHYLTLTSSDLERLGPVAKCAPPLRSSEQSEHLWEALRNGWIDIVASDHSPCPTEMKETTNQGLFEAWGGISGGQQTLELMLTEGYVNRGVPLQQIADWLSLNPAKRFGLYPRKGEITLFADADLVLVDFNHAYILEKQDLKYRHKHSPYIGRSLSCKVHATIARGQVVYTLDQHIEEEPQGNWIPYQNLS